MDNQHNFALPVKYNRSLDNKFALKLLTTLHNIKKYKSHVQKHFIRHRASLSVESSLCLHYILIFTHPHINFTAFFCCSCTQTHDYWVLSNGNRVYFALQFVRHWVQKASVSSKKQCYLSKSANLKRKILLILT